MHRGMSEVRWRKGVGVCIYYAIHICCIGVRIMTIYKLYVQDLYNIKFNIKRSKYTLYICICVCMYIFIYKRKWGRK